MTIKTRLIVGFGACLAVIALLGFLSVYQLRNVASKGAEVIEKDCKILENGTRLRANLNMMRRFEKSAFITIGDAGKVDDYRKKWEEAHDRFSALLEGLNKLESEPKNREMLATVAKDLASYRSGFLAVLNRIKEGAINSTQEADKAIDAFKEATHQIEKNIIDYNKRNDENIARAEKGLKDTVRKTTLLVAGLVAAACIAILVFVVFLIRSITHPTAKLLETAASIEKGDLTARCMLEGNDEMAKIALSFDRIAAAFTNSINSLSALAADVTAAASKVHASSEDMAEGAHKVTSEATTVATAGEEMAATSGDIARNCQMAADSAQQASAQATDGAAIIQASIQVMERIAERVQQSAQTVSSLGQRSDQIGQIIGTIQDIADQTNLLALNAAIEAARAGEMGRGFAVVADEVRALAERTTKATREIDQMIKNIQQETQSAVSSMEEGVQQVQQGTVEAGRSGEAIEAILEQINNLSMQISQIATAAEEQTATTSEISSNMLHITEVISHNEQNARSSAHEAGRLNELAETLLQTLAQYTVEESVSLSLHRAKSAHMIFTGKIRAHLGGGLTLDPDRLSTHLTCVFGRWYQETGKKLCGHLPLYKEIETPHARVHELGKQAILAHNAGDHAKARQLYTEMLENSNRLIELLDQMLQESASLMQWGPQFSVNIRQFDTQHKRLIDMVNQLNDAMSSGKGHQVLKSIFDGLIQYTATHFADEEKVMAEYQYPELEMHQKAHKELVKTALELQKKLHGSSHALSTEVMAFLRNWLINHIQGLDKKYGVYLNSKGLN